MLPVLKSAAWFYIQLHNRSETLLWTTDSLVCENPDKSALNPENMCHHYRNWWNFTCLLVNNHEHTFHQTCESSLLPSSQSYNNN